MAVNTEVKGQLAKLLATENLNVEHRKITTAYFDVDRRVLALPIWKDVSNDVYDLLVGHEVGHALYTPKEDFGSAPKDFVNVLEDVRVERKMKVTYPGLKKSFYKGYTELLGRNFFGVDGRDLTTLSLIDRINLFFKIGSFTEIPFKEDEKVWLQRAVKTVTFRDVVDLSIELYEFMKSQKSDDKEDMPEMPLPQNGNQSADAEQQPSSSSSSDGEEEKEWPTESDPETDHRADRDYKENADLDTPSYEHGESEGDELESITDAASQKAQRDLVDDNAKEWIYLDLPKVNIKEIIRPYREVLNDLSTHFNRKWSSEQEQSYWDKGLEFQSNKYREFKNSSVKTVNYMVKQFEMKKSADVYARAGVSRTGVVNTNSLYKYKLTDDIFKKVVTVPEGKNHGLIMYLDWSGSMSQGTPSGNLLSDTLKQTYNLVWFCKKVSIPFRVYAFNSGYNKEEGLNDQKMFELKDRSLGLNESFDLYELFSSKMKKAELEDQMRLLWTHVWGMNSYHISSHPRYSLGGTPLGEAVICTPEIVKSFRKTEGIDKVNVIILSDGESNPLSYVRECSYENYRWREDPEKLKDEGPWYRQDYLCHQYHKIFILRDPETRQTVRLNPEASYTTKEIVSFFNKITDYNWIGIRIGNKGDLTAILNQIPYYSLRAQYEKQWSKEKFCAIAEYGYDELYVFPSNNMGGGERDLDVKQKGESATAGELTRAFKKHMNSKMTNKSILNKFVEQIA